MAIGKFFLYQNLDQFVLIGPAKILKISWQTDKVLMAKMNLNRDFALARKIIHDHENGYFLKILLHHEDFVSGKSFVSYYTCNYFEQS